MCSIFQHVFVCVSIFYALSICLLRTTPKSSRRNGTERRAANESVASLERSSSSSSSTWHWPAYCWLPVCLAVALSPVSPFRRRRRLFAALLLSKFMIIALPSILRAADSIRLSPNGGGTRCCCCWCRCRSSACAAAAADSGGGGREKPSDSAVIKIGFCAQLNHIFAFNWRLDSRVLT